MLNLYQSSRRLCPQPQHELLAPFNSCVFFNCLEECWVCFNAHKLFMHLEPASDALRELSPMCP